MHAENSGNEYNTPKCLVAMGAVLVFLQNGGPGGEGEGAAGFGRINSANIAGGGEAPPIFPSQLSAYIFCEGVHFRIRQVIHADGGGVEAACCAHGADEGQFALHAAMDEVQLVLGVVNSVHHHGIGRFRGRLENGLSVVRLIANAQSPQLHAWANGQAALRH